MSYKQHTLSKNEYNYLFSPTINTTIIKNPGDTISNSEMGVNTCFYLNFPDGIVSVTDQIPVNNYLRFVVSNSNRISKVRIHLKNNQIENGSELGTIPASSALTLTLTLAEGTYNYQDSATSDRNCIIVIGYTGDYESGSGRDFFEIYNYGDSGGRWCIIKSSNFLSFMNTGINTGVSTGKVVYINGQDYGFGITQFGTTVAFPELLPPGGDLPTFVTSTDSVWFYEYQWTNDNGYTEYYWVNRGISQANAETAPYIFDNTYYSSIKVLNNNFQWTENWVPCVALVGKNNNSSNKTVDVTCERGFIKGFAIIARNFTNAQEHRLENGTFTIDDVDGVLNYYQYQMYSGVDVAQFRQSYTELNQDYNNWQPIGGVGVIMNDYADWGKADGWGNDPKINSEGYLTRYTLNESQFKRLKSFTIPSSGTGLGIVYTATNVTPWYSNAPANPNLNDWIRHTDGTSSVWKGSSRGWVYESAQNDLSQLPYMAYTNKESNLYVKDGSGSYKTFIFLAIQLEGGPSTDISYTINTFGEGSGYVILSNYISPNNDSQSSDWPCSYYSAIRISRQLVLKMGYSSTNEEWMFSGDYGVVLATSSSDRSGWGNTINYNCKGQLQRFTLSESEYYSLSQQTGQVLTYSSGPITASGQYNVDNGAKTDLYYQTAVLVGSFNTYETRLTLGADYPVYARIKLIDSIDSNHMIFLPPGHIIRYTSSINDLGNYTGQPVSAYINQINYNSRSGVNFIYDTNGQFVTFFVTTDSDVFDTIEFTYYGNNLWEYQLYDFKAWQNGALPWVKVDKTGSYIGDLGDVDTSGGSSSGTFLGYSFSDGKWKPIHQIHPFLLMGA